MATIKPILPSRGRAALLATAWLVVPLTAGETTGGGSLADKEAARRSVAVEEAQMLLQKGDEAYQAGRYSDAVDAYAGARDLIPDAPATTALRQAATDRYAQASVEKAKGQSRKGDVAGAKATVDKVLAENVAPNDPGALTYRAQLDDPIRTNPALTAEHGKDIDEVRRLLYTAEGAYQLGKFDEAKVTYEKVLRIDPTNSAARRGMEVVASAKRGYSKSAYDHTRVEMLAQVDAAWETPIAEKVEFPTGPELGRLDKGLEMTVEAKIKQLIVPKVNLDQVSVEEAVDFLRTVKADDGSGVNITVNLGPPGSEIARKIRGTKFSLQLSGVPMAQVLKYITDATHTSFTTDDFAVVITPAGSTSSELVSRSYRVPPDFVTNISTGGAGGDAANPDPFGGGQAKDGLLTARLSVQEALAKQGVGFPEGASASYVASTNTLRVINTATNQDLISQMVQSAAQTEPVIVALRVTMIKVQQDTLTELGYDWLVNPIGLTASTMFASGGTPGNTPGRRRIDFVSPVGGTSVDGVPADPGSLVRNLATNGLRSGDYGVQSNTLDGMLNNPDHTVLNNVAPGVMAVTGLFSDGQVQMVMRGLNQKKGVDIMAKPAVVTRSGQQANIDIIREFIYPSEYEPPELPNSVGDTNGGGSPVTPAMPTAFETKNVGVELEVLPVADPEKRYVDITLNPSFTDFDGFVNYGSPINSNSTDALGNATVTRLTNNLILMPVFSVQRANTQVTVADGATIAIGGLMAESIQNVEDKVPVLGSLPIIGRLFTTEARKPVSTAVIFLVNVELMDPTGRPYRDR